MGGPTSTSTPSPSPACFPGVVFLDHSRGFSLRGMTALFKTQENMSTTTYLNRPKTTWSEARHESLALSGQRGEWVFVTRDLGHESWTRLVSTGILFQSGGGGGGDYAWILDMYAVAED